MQVMVLSGTTVVQLDESELRCMVERGKSIGDLKQLLSTQVGCSRFQQRLFSDDLGELVDDMSLRQLPTVGLVILPFCAFDKIMDEELLRNCKANDVDEIEGLLQRPQDPNGEVCSLQLNGHLEVVQLFLEAGASNAFWGNCFVACCH